MKVAFIAENLRTRLPGVVKGAFDAESLIGRQRQRECLRAWVNELTKGRGRAVLVEGEPGIGKTFMLKAAVRQAEAASCRVLWGACDELSQVIGYASPRMLTLGCWPAPPSACCNHLSALSVLSHSPI